MTIKYQPDAGGWLAIDELDNTGSGATKAAALQDLKRQIALDQEGRSVVRQHGHDQAQKRRKPEQRNDSVGQKGGAPFDGDEVIRAARIFILRTWRRRYEGRRDDRRKLNLILSTPRLAQVLECYESREKALQSLVWIVPTVCGLRDALSYREEKETQAYREALDAVTAIISKLQEVGPLVSSPCRPVKELKAAARTIQFELKYADKFMQQLPLRPEHVGTRGGAGDNEAAIAGAVTRALDDLLPDIPERAAFIADLMRAAGRDTYNQKVTGIISRWHEKKARPH